MHIGRCLDTHGCVLLVKPHRLIGRVLPKAEAQIAPALMSVYGEMWIEGEADASRSSSSAVWRDLPLEDTQNATSNVRLSIRELIPEAAY